MEEQEEVDALAFDLKGLCDRSREGSIATQANRRRMLAQMAEALKSFKLPGARSIKPKHVEFLIEHWRAEDISAATIKNRMSVLRWWCAAVNKSSIMQRDNEEYGIEPRAAAKPRGKVLKVEDVKRLASPYHRATVTLTAVFGLRLEEAIKFQPTWADHGDHIMLKPSWCKGGRGRVIPVRSPYQRHVLNRVHAVAGAGSLIPADRSYIQQRKAFENACYAAKIGNVHGYRHGYAQQRYEELTGWAAPAAGGPDASALNERERKLDRAARLKISNELGHNRVSICTVYLGT